MSFGDAPVTSEFPIAPALSAWWQCGMWIPLLAVYTSSSVQLFTLNFKNSDKTKIHKYICIFLCIWSSPGHAD